MGCWGCCRWGGRMDGSRSRGLEHGEEPQPACPGSASRRTWARNGRSPREPASPFAIPTNPRRPPSPIVTPRTSPALLPSGLAAPAQGPRGSRCLLRVIHDPLICPAGMLRHWQSWLVVRWEKGRGSSKPSSPSPANSFCRGTGSPCAYIHEKIQFHLGNGSKELTPSAGSST